MASRISPLSQGTQRASTPSLPRAAWDSLTNLFNSLCLNSPPINRTELAPLRGRLVKCGLSEQFVNNASIKEIYTQLTFLNHGYLKNNKCSSLAEPKDIENALNEIQTAKDQILCDFFESFHSVLPLSAKISILLRGLKSKPISERAEGLRQLILSGLSLPTIEEILDYRAKCLLKVFQNREPFGEEVFRTTTRQEPSRASKEPLGEELIREPRTDTDREKAEYNSDFLSDKILSKYRIPKEIPLPTDITSKSLSYLLLNAANFGELERIKEIFSHSQANNLSLYKEALQGTIKGNHTAAMEFILDKAKNRPYSNWEWINFIEQSDSECARRFEKLRPKTTSEIVGTTLKGLAIAFVGVLSLLEFFQPRIFSQKLIT